MKQVSYDDTASLYLVPTPIGNLDDITYRSINILNEVEVIFSEDTRVTSILLNHFNIKKKLISLHEHNEDILKDKVLEYLNDGYSVALVTDRGTPIISDPGYKTVKYITDNHFNVISLPGATAFVPALTMSGIAPQPFIFYGFLNSKDSKKMEELKELKDNKYTMIFYEAPHRIDRTLNMMKDILGDRNVSLSREISKKYETIYRGKISEVLNILNEKQGEFVIVVEGSSDEEMDENLSIIELVDAYVKSGCDLMDAMKKVARLKGISKSEVYHEYHREGR